MGIQYPLGVPFRILSRRGLVRRAGGGPAREESRRGDGCRTVWPEATKQRPTAFVMAGRSDFAANSGAKPNRATGATRKKSIRSKHPR